nr:MAG TPA: hypothetical protein [Bacteriophage sp.]DAY34917.1 MAG TPA: hypothetical protein [Bacteriophage sp.]
MVLVKMFNNEIEELVLKEEVEIPPHDKRTRSDAPYMELNANMFKLYTQCKYKIDSPDTIYRNLSQIVSFDGLSSEDENLNARERASLALYEAIKVYMSDLNGPSNTPILYFERKIKKILPNEDEGVESYKASLRRFLTEILDRISDRIYHSNGAINDELIFWSYGRKPRKTFHTVIDLVLLMDDGIEIFLLTPFHQDNRNNPMYAYNNPRTMAVVKHIEDIGITIKTIHEIRVPFGWTPNSNVSVTKRPNFSDGHLKEIAIKFINSDSTSGGNPGKCSACLNHSYCGIQKMIPDNF